jgi:cytoskeletal protein RodZ
MLGSMTDDHDQLDPAEALMRAVGAQLREVRQERREELDDIAQQLRIKAIYLFGIEQGDLSMMPGRTYALGFLRSYADYLGFDGDDLIAQIKSTVANLTDRTRLRIRTPLPESRLPKTPLLVLSLAALAGIYAGWSYLNRSGQLVIETVAEVPGNLRSMALDALNEDGEPSDGARPGERNAAPAAGADAPVAPAGDQGLASPPPATAAAGPDSRTATVSPAPPPPPRAERAAAPEPTLASPAPLTDHPSPSAPGERTTAAAAPPRAVNVQPPTPHRVAGAERQLAASAYADAQPAAGPPAAGDQAAGPSLERAPPAVAELRERLERLQVELGAPAAAEPAATKGILAARSAEPAGIEATGQVYEPENTDARVVLRARDSSWIRISSLGGDYLRSRTLQQGDLFLVPNRTDLELWTGNAGGIEVILDGTLLARIGEEGAVVRDVPLDPPSLRARFGDPVAR